MTTSAGNGHAVVDRAAWIDARPDDRKTSSNADTLERLTQPVD